MALVLLAGCASETETIEVFAASSMTDVMLEAEVQFEAEHDDIDVRVNLAGSNALLRQINDGAEVDVYVPADSSFIDQITDAQVAETHLIARNELVIVMAAGASINGADDLATATVARCASGVPCGNYADQLIEELGLSLGTVSEEANVRSVLAKVRSGDVDAGFVYRTDAERAALPVLELIESPQTEIVVAVFNGDDDEPDSEITEFLALLTSPEFANVLLELGFTQP